MYFRHGELMRNLLQNPTTKELETSAAVQHKVLQQKKMSCGLFEVMKKIADNSWENDVIINRLITVICYEI